MSKEKDKKTEKTNKKKIGKGRVLLTLVLLLVVSVVGVHIVKSEMTIIELEQEKKAQEERNVELERTRDDLKIEIESINSDEYIERIARNDLKLVKPNEILFVLQDDEDKE